MELEQRFIDLGSVRLTVWGPPSDTVLVAVHGKQSHQLDADILAARDHALARKSRW